MSTSEWAKFFEASGIPRSASAQYAVNFAENRISMDMLLDLNKEYLRDLGVSALGDIIAILKHAKTVQGQMATAKVFHKVDTEAKTNPSSQSTRTVVPLTSGRKPVVNRNPSPKGNLPSPVPLNSSRPQTKSVSSESRFKSGPSESRFEQKKVTSRLGPPKPITFAEIGLGPKAEKVHKPIKAPASAITTTSSSVFNRLGGSSNETISSSNRHVIKPLQPVSRPIEAPSSTSKSAFERLGQANETRSISRVRETPTFSSRVDSETSTNIRKLIPTSRNPRKEEDESSESGDLVKDLKKRVMIKKGLMACPVRTLTTKTPTTNQSRHSSKSLILVRTFSDGTKAKERISADDPILKDIQFKVTKIPKTSDSVCDPAIAREPRKRQLISPPPPSSSSNSTASQLSRTKTTIRNERGNSPKPLNRKRVSAPGFNDEVHHGSAKVSRIKSRLGPRPSL